VKKKKKGWLFRKGRGFRLLDLFTRIKDHFFLKEYHPSGETMQLLRELYPTVNWTRVSFHEGLPWFTPILAPYITAQALPDFYSFSRFKIYLLRFDESRARCVAEIAHEGYHIRQAMHFWKGYGLGFFRGLMVYYSAYFLKYGYRSNPFEEPAYNQEYAFLDKCIQHGSHAVSLKIDKNILKKISQEKDLVFKEYKFKYQESKLALIGSFFFCLVMAILKPLFDMVVFLIGSLITAFTSLTSKPGIKNAK
jgi:hypothetical protein